MNIHGKQPQSCWLHDQKAQKLSVPICNVKTRQNTKPEEGIQVHEALCRLHTFYWLKRLQYRSSNFISSKMSDLSWVPTFLHSHHWVLFQKSLHFTFQFVLKVCSLARQSLRASFQQEPSEILLSSRYPSCWHNLYHSTSSSASTFQVLLTQKQTAMKHITLDNYWDLTVFQISTPVLPYIRDNIQFFLQTKSLHFVGLQWKDWNCSI